VTVGLLCAGEKSFAVVKKRLAFLGKPVYTYFINNGVEEFHKPEELWFVAGFMKSISFYFHSVS